jgi:hypothetical protein
LTAVMRPPRGAVNAERWETRGDDVVFLITLRNEWT